MPMTITVRELISNPHLKTKAIAGSSGLEREITWAHVCELQDPSPWLSGGELILTTGLAIPRYTQQQEEYLQCLINTGVSGLAIAENMYAPELTSHLLSEADKRSFPILLTSYEIPWLAITRTVADANTHKEHERVLQTLRVYEIARQAMNSSSPVKILDMLSNVINCTIYVVDPVNKKSIFDVSLPNDFEEFLKFVRPNDTPSSPTVQHIMKKGISALQISVPTSRPAILVAIPNNDVLPNNLVLRHITTILGMVIEKETVIHERLRRLGTELLSGLIDGRIAPEAANLLLAEHKLLKDSFYIVTCSSNKKPFKHEWLHLQLSARDIPHLLTQSDNTLIALVPSTKKAITSLQEELPPNVRLGISNIFTSPSKIPEALQEALWALKAAETNEKIIVYYSEELSISPFLPRSKKEAHTIVEQVLGDLIAYDKKNNSQLIMTLFIYLNENRSWQIASKKLNIHKQTLVYRINKIELLTDRRLNVTNNVAELWLALQTATMLGILPDLFNDKVIVQY
jgi:PucR family transcriptional regulator, purine catabolism regulatory protein